MSPAPIRPRKSKVGGRSKKTSRKDRAWLSFLETVPDAFVAVDDAGTIVHVNAQAEALFGYPRKELIGQKIEMLVPERYRTQHHQDRSHFAKKPKLRKMGEGLDLFGRRRDGTEFPIDIGLSPVPTADGMLVLSAIRDVSARKRIEEQLRKAHDELDRSSSQQISGYRSRLAAIVDSSEDAILGKDLNGIITDWNKGAEHLYGYSADEVVGKSISILIPPGRPDEIPGILEKIRRGETVTHYESIRVTKDGRHLNMSISISPIRDATNQVVGASAIARDITAQKRTEEQVRQAQKLEAIGRLAGGVAHDFNNILGIISACTELLRDRIAQEAGAQYIDNIRTAAERGATLTRQLLAFGRKQIVQPQVFDLNERLRDTSKLLRPLMGDDVEVVIVSRSASASASALVEVDPVHLDQIVLNLAVNARDAMPRGGKLVLETAVMEFDEAFAREHPPMAAGRHLQLAVSDTGIGMDPATLPHIFEPFFTTKELGKGTGLGLATVYGIVRQNGGFITVYSEPGRGSTFKVYLPSADHKIGLYEAPEPEPVLPKRHGTTILLVEDDGVMRGLTRQMLEEHGYTVIEAEDGKSALVAAEASRTPIDLVLTDVVMRSMSGPELTQQLHQFRPATKVVYMSGYTGELIAERDVLKPGITLLEKPFTRSSLLKIIHSALE